MRSLSIIIACLLIIASPVLAQKKVTVHVIPADATIYEIVPATNIMKPLGAGTAVVIVQKNSETAIIIQKPGFADLKKVYSTKTEEKLPKEDFLTMKDRMVALKVWPEDARIFVNNSELEKGTAKIVVKDGERINVEIKKSGYVPVKKIYSNQPGTDLPPVNDEIKLSDKIIQIVAIPSDAKIIADNQVIGTGNGMVVVQLDKSVNVKIVKEGYADLEKTYWNREESPELPINESFLLTDRIVLLRTSPEGVSIKINGRFVANGEFNVKVAKGETVEVLLEKEGFIAVRTKYINQDNAPVIPIMDQIELFADESFAASEPADFVNTNNIIEINANIKEDEAWKIMSQIVMTYFDVLEITDKTTGYLRTAWAVKVFPNNTIRTRLIVKVADSSTLKYVVKLCSESSGRSGSNSNDDSLYTEWQRVLETYKSVVGDMRTRLK
ncbi:MAG: hypothetical protein A2X18_04875 [Bacteroidetes bacterium GWF2_40_14]|nr:MAG: hypothetical protein A2X18_04875 [Bacteroidetes bacterium GWF2_40_14]